MKTPYACLTAIALATAGLAAGASETARTHPQERFAACSHDAKGLKADERQRFMSECLKTSAGPTHETRASTHAAGSQQDRMRACNVTAGERQLHGDERRAFMSSCLKG